MVGAPLQQHFAPTHRIRCGLVPLCTPHAQRRYACVRACIHARTAVMQFNCGHAPHCTHQAVLWDLPSLVKHIFATLRGLNPKVIAPCLLAMWSLPALDAPLKISRPFAPDRCSCGVGFVQGRGGRRRAPALQRALELERHETIRALLATRGIEKVISHINM